MELSIIILTWNSQKFIQNCLESLFSATQHLKKEVIIIDNGSKDKTVDYIEKTFPEIILVKNKVNRGVGPARNQGIKIAKGDFILILDADTVVHNNSIDILLDIGKTYKNAGIIGPKLIGSDGKLQYSCRFFPSILSKLYRQLPNNMQNKLLKREEMRDWPHDKNKEVDYVIGACQLINKKLLQEIGLFDNNMFYGVEEIDFCLRAWKRGWKVIYTPFAIITHAEQRLGIRKFYLKLQLEHFKSLAIYFLKNKYLFNPPELISHEN